MEISKTVINTHHTVTDGDRMIGQIIGNDTDGWRAEYWVPVLVDGQHNGQYGVKDSNFTSDLESNMLTWLEDQDALYGHRPQLALQYCR